MQVPNQRICTRRRASSKSLATMPSSRDWACFRADGFVSAFLPRHLPAQRRHPRFFGHTRICFSASAPFFSSHRSLRCAARGVYLGECSNSYVVRSAFGDQQRPGGHERDHLDFVKGSFRRSAASACHHCSHHPSSAAFPFALCSRAAISSVGAAAGVDGPSECGLSRRRRCAAELKVQAAHL